MDKPVHISYTDCDKLNALVGHEIILATLPCGMIMALDPTGMQFGWKECISPWSAYLEHRVYHIGDTKDIGPDSVGHQELDYNQAIATLTLAGVIPADHISTKRLEQRLMETVVLSLQSQIKARFGGVKEFLQLKGSKYTAAAAAFVAAAKRGLTVLADEINGGAEIKVIQPPSPPGSSNTKSGDEQKEIIWSSTRDRRIGNGDVNKLRRLWKIRWDKEVGIDWPQPEGN
jgi:hypothetical protein